FRPSLFYLTVPNRHGTDPYAWWCGRGEAVRLPPIPILVAVYTLRGEEIRLISARRARRREVKSYES
ncbi:MAG: hypothetical protein ACHBNF_22025, partial [Chromatiales bacterium]